MLFFWDIGAHYGYFSLLASELVKKGNVMSVEASPTTFQLLQKNCGSVQNIIISNVAVGKESGMTSFFEFPNLFSEFNSTDLTQYLDEKWFAKNKPHKVSVPTTTLDNLLDQQGKIPNIIKIDVEGGEYAVLQGATKLLSREKAPFIAMEYLNPERHNEPHQKAVQYLAEFGYKPHVIEDNGDIVPINNIEHHLERRRLESDNIVFRV